MIAPDVRMYHNPLCSKSRQTLALIEARGIRPQVVEYLKTPLQHDEIAGLLALLGIGARQLLRKGEAAFEEEGLADPLLNEDNVIAAMVRRPILIERPVVVCGGRAAIGRPPENILAILPQPENRRKSK